MIWSCCRNINSTRNETLIENINNFIDNNDWNFSVDEKGSIEKINNNIIESISILINKDLDLFSSKINQN